ncbi:MAG TPA: alpha/beta hydrolase [Dongiaceae bacterium]|jgi:pimeloyl-ACP methyl ester carboxylesterase|nr:alpha/beta hydrolase [Dongiaceae bacterium]
MLDVPADELPRRSTGNTAFISAGSGAPLVFVHGVGMCADAWSPQIEHFSARRKVIALDMLGHGRSAPPPQHATLHDYADQVVRLMDDLGLKTAALVGHSMGALVCLAVATQNPARCERIACLNAVYKRDPENKAAVQARARGILAEIGAASSNAQTLRRWFGENPTARDREIAQLTDRWLRDVSRTGYSAAYAVFADSDTAFVGKLPELAAPALFATGEFDPNSTPEMSWQMAAEAKNGQAEIVAGARHMMNLTHPAETNRLLNCFLGD